MQRRAENHRDLQQPRVQSEVTTMMNRLTTLRVARATDRLDEVVRFYVEGLGFDQLGSFENHEGFDGVMVGVPGATYHLEFTHQPGHAVGKAPTEENLLIFYL